MGTLVLTLNILGFEKKNCKKSHKCNWRETKNYTTFE